MRKLLPSVVYLHWDLIRSFVRVDGETPGKSLVPSQLLIKLSHSVLELCFDINTTLRATSLRASLKIEQVRIRGRGIRSLSRFIYSEPMN